MVNKLINFIQDGQKLTVNYDNKPLILTVITPEIVRVFQDRGNASNSYAIDGDKSIKTDFKVKKKMATSNYQRLNLPLRSTMTRRSMSTMKGQSINSRLS